MPPDLDLDPEHADLLNLPALQDWIDAQAGIPGSGPVTSITRLTGGSQNNIFLMARTGGAFVLRRPPRHLRDNSNDTMLREARVLGALAGTDVPHPRLYAVCDDPDVLGGATFYVMAPIEGFVPMGPLPDPYDTDPTWRNRIGFTMVEAAAKLAAVDHETVGLADFGRSEHWAERQVGRWRSQLEGYADVAGYPGPDLPGVDELGDWLDRNRPAAVRIGILHGDYQFANVMLEPDRPELAAIIDWELCTLGDPMLDLAWMCTAWTEESDPEGRAPQLQPWDAMASRAELVAHYGDVTGRPIDDFPWFFVLACYKLGILLEGTHARACAGKAPRQIGDALHAYARWLFAKGQQLVAG